MTVSTLGSSLSALAGVEGEAVAVGGEGDDTALGEVEDITRDGLDKGALVSEMEMACMWHGRPASHVAFGQLLRLT